MEEQIQKLREMLSQSRNTVAVTGAGISMAAGIRDMQHLNFLEVIQLMSESVLKSSPTHYYKIAWKNFLQPMFEKGPTVTHKTLARLEGEGKLRGIITTNIDCLHTLAGSKEVTELQGSFAVNRCTKCGKMHYGARLWGQGDVPRCTQCGGLLSAFPVYNRAGLDREAVKKAQEMISHAELVIITGAQGCYGDVYYYRIPASAKIVQINPSATQFDGKAVLNIHTKADTVFEQLG